MTYIELINRFWALNKEYSFTPNEKAVYFALLNKANELGWKNPYNQSNGYLAMDSGMSESAMQKARNTLKQYELIEFKSGDGRRNNTEYTITGVEKGSFKTCLSDTLSGKGSSKNYLSGTLSDTLSCENRTTNTRSIDKIRKEKILSLSGDGKIEEREKFFEILFFDKRIKSTVNEFERFYNHYEARGWCDNSGKKIANKFALLKNWEVKNAAVYPEKFTKNYRKIYGKAKGLLKESPLFLITDFHGFSEKCGTFEMSVSKKLFDFLEKNIDAFKPDFREIIGADGKLKYKIREAV